MGPALAVVESMCFGAGEPSFLCWLHATPRSPPACRGREHHAGGEGSDALGSVQLTRVRDDDKRARGVVSALLADGAE
jgi:hypothetical protein